MAKGLSSEEEQHWPAELCGGPMGGGTPQGSKGWATQSWNVSPPVIRERGFRKIQSWQLVVGANVLLKISQCN